uniref:Interferon regulatory factor-3 domain-containing protein n=1 Tax=Phocoena sinus TaxID=42100 RepID=A0A8C9DZU6_PHOSS
PLGSLPCCEGRGSRRRQRRARVPPFPAEFWLHVRLFYGAELVREATARAAEGCSLSPRADAAAAELLLGSPPRVAQFRFPEPPPGARVLRRLLPHLERGVLLWVAPEGVFAKRLCQGRVYWRGPLAPHRARPNKLERELTCQLLDTRSFLAELRAHLHHGRQEPEYQIRLCFGEEYPGPPDQPEERLIMAHVSHLPHQRKTTPSSLPERPLTAPSSPSSAPNLPYLIWKTLRVKCMWRGAVTPAPPPQQRVWVKGKVGSLPHPHPAGGASLRAGARPTLEAPRPGASVARSQPRIPDSLTHLLTQLSQP